MKTVDGKPATRMCIDYRFGDYCSQETIKKWVEEGFKPTESNRNIYVKCTETVRYSAQVHPKNLGTEPNYNQSVHSHRYNTIYFSVSKEEFDAMEVKPELTKQVRPARYHNFDGFVEMIQSEKVGMGWREQDRTYDDTNNYIYFVE